MAVSKNSRPFFVLALIECLVLCAAFAGSFLLVDGALPVDDAWRTLASVLSVCIVVEIMMLAVGLFSWHATIGFSDLFVRMFAAMAIAYAAYAILVYVFDFLRLPPDILFVGLIFALPASLLLWVAFIRLSNLAQLKNRVLVLGTGKQAARISELEKQEHTGRFVTVGFISLATNNPDVD